MFKYIQAVTHRSKYFFNLESFRNYLIFPVFRGFLGFSLFLLSIIVSKYIGLLAGVSASFRIESSDLSISSLGFLFLFLLGLLKNLSDN